MWHTQAQTGRLVGQSPREGRNSKPVEPSPKRVVGRPTGSKRKTLGNKWYSELTHAISAWPAMGLMIGD